VPRDELFVTTKLRGEEQGYNNAFRALDASRATDRVRTTSTCT
jgi:diketogulonate reductase-like aldo/keto reductase